MPLGSPFGPLGILVARRPRGAADFLALAMCVSSVESRNGAGPPWWGGAPDTCATGPSPVASILLGTAVVKRSFRRRVGQRDLVAAETVAASMLSVPIC